MAPATCTSDAKFFPSASFAPAIGLITVGSGGAVLQSSMPINDNDFGMKTAILDSAGAVVVGADVTACSVDASGSFITDAAALGCTAGNTARPARGADTERSTRLWLIKFNKKLTEFSMR